MHDDADLLGPYLFLAVVTLVSVLATVLAATRAPGKPRAYAGSLLLGLGLLPFFAGMTLAAAALGEHTVRGAPRSLVSRRTFLVQATLGLYFSFFSSLSIVLGLLKQPMPLLHPLVATAPAVALVLATGGGSFQGGEATNGAVDFAWATLFQAVVGTYAFFIADAIDRICRHLRIYCLRLGERED